MKKVNLIMLVLIFLSTFSFSQEYSKVDSVKLSKSEIREATMSYISEKWNSANDVIQMNSEKQILIKAQIKVLFPYRMGSSYIYWFNYTIKFQFKDKKVRMLISNIYNDGGRITGGRTKVCAISIKYKESDECPSTFKMNSPKKKVVKAMQNLDNDFNLILIDYFNYLENYNSKNDEW